MFKKMPWLGPWAELLSDWMKCWRGPATLVEYLNRRAAVKFKNVWRRRRNVWSSEAAFRPSPMPSGKDLCLLSSATRISPRGESGNLLNGPDLESGKVASSNKFLTSDFRNPSVLKTSVTHILKQVYLVFSLQNILGSLSSSKMLKSGSQRNQTNQTKQWQENNYN